jgi:predicted 3-demethylubiquinone-9 3-methyltransferase (glyoxalase superfamily)
MGATWLTLFPAKEASHLGSNPRNTEFAIQVAEPAEVDTLYQAFIEAGAKKGWEPFDTEMYEAMRFSFIDDPFGVRIDIICPIEKSAV